VAVQSEAKILATWLLRLWVWIPLRAWVFRSCLYMLFCPKKRPCDDLIPHPRCPAIFVCQKKVCDGESLGHTATGVTLGEKKTV